MAGQVAEVESGLKVRHSAAEQSIDVNPYVLRAYLMTSMIYLLIPYGQKDTCECHDGGYIPPYSRIIAQHGSSGMNTRSGTYQSEHAQPADHAGISATLLAGLRVYYPSCLCRARKGDGCPAGSCPAGRCPAGTYIRQTERRWLRSRPDTVMIHEYQFRSILLPALLLC